MKRLGRDIWHEPDTGRLYCWWRVLAFFGVALLTTCLFANVLAIPFYSPALTAKALPPALPQYLEERIGLVALIAGCWFAGAWCVRRFEQLPLDTLGLPLRWRGLGVLLLSLLAGLMIPGALAAAFLCCGMARVHYHAAGLLGWQQFGLAAVLILLATLGEELMVHGYLLQTMLRGIGLSAWLLISVLWVIIVYLRDPGMPAIALANLLVLVLLFGMVYLRTGTLWASIGVSTGWSLGGVFLHPTPLEGLVGTVSAPISIALRGPSWLSGGSAGPEAGAALSIVLLILLGMLTYARQGLALDAHWWEWRTLALPRALSIAWDFSIGSRYYQWKLLPRDEAK